MNKNEDIETKHDTVQFKKDKLMCHIPFIEEMILKLKGTKFEKNWQTMFNCITSDKKKMTIAQIYKLDETIRSRQADDRNAENEVAAEPAKPKVPEAIKPKVPKPTDLGKPVLSTTDILELIEDLGEPTPAAEIDVKPAADSKPDPYKKNRSPSPLKSPFMVRLPSSCIPSKSAAPLNRPGNKGFISPPPSPASAFLKGFKIPKKSPMSGGSSSEPQKSSPNVRLETINIFEQIEEEEKQKKLKKLSLDETLLLHTKIKFTAKDDKHEISGKSEDPKVQSPPEQKKQENVLMKETVDEPSTSDKPPSPQPLLEEPSSLTESSATNKEQKDAVEDKTVQPVASSEVVESAQERKRIAKEMRRLHENIVKDDAPLAPRRSCTLKRSGRIYQDSPVTTEGSSADDQDLSRAKRTKSESGTPEKEEKKSAFTEKRNKRKSISVMPKKVEPPVKKTTRSSLLAQKMPDHVEKPSSVRTTRRSAAALDKSREEPQEPPAKKLRKDAKPSPSAFEKIIKTYEIKPCEIKLPSLSPEKLTKKPPVKFKQTARKSTGGRQTPISPKSSTNDAPRSMSLNSVNLHHPSVSPTQSKSLEQNSDDDEWEDLPSYEDEPEESSAENSGLLDSSVRRSLRSFKTICNIAYVLDGNGAIHRCKIQGCTLQTTDKHSFINHIESQHRDVSWNGFCTVCQDFVLPEKKNSIMSELMHMVEEHLLKEKFESKKKEKKVEPLIPEIPAPVEEPIEVPEPEEPEAIPLDKASTSESDSDLIKGMDSLIETLLPSKSDKQDASNAHSRSSFIHPNVSLIQSPSLQAATVIPTISSSVALKSNVTTKVISKNLIGRVITLPTGLLQNAKRLVPCNEKSISPAKSISPPKLNVTPPSSPSLVKPAVTPSVISTSSSASVLSTETVVPASSSAVSSEKIKSYVIKRPVVVGKTLPIVIKHNLSVKERTSWLPTENAKKIVSIDDGSNLAGSFRSVVYEHEQAPRDPLRFQEVLRSWLGIRTKKNPQSLKVLTSPYALTADFKCLATNCGFFTSAADLFYLHLQIHNKFTPEDKANYLSCAYCRFQSTRFQRSPDSLSDKAKDLIDHFGNEHSFDCYQCQYCFYRSRADFNVIAHQNMFHKLKPRNILQIEEKHEQVKGNELHEIKRQRAHNVPRMTCVYCKAPFYVFRTFLSHLKQHKEEDSKDSKCTKCGERTTKYTVYKHLVNCHGFGLYQCVYCRFGSNSFDVMTNHIANNHPSKLPVYCERADSKVIDPRVSSQLSASIDSTTLKHVNHTVNTVFLKKAPKDEALLRNKKNVDQIICNASYSDKSTMPPGLSNGKSHLITQPLRINAPQVPRKPVPIQGAHQMHIAPQNIHYAPQTRYVKFSNQPPSKPAHAPQIIAPAPKPSGIQIQNVFSLSTLPRTAAVLNNSRIQQGLELPDVREKN